MSEDGDTPRIVSDRVTDPRPVVAVAPASIPRTANALAPGDRLGDHHTVIRLVGAGGMGEVYLARDAKLARDVAVKIVHPALARDGESWRDRLIREAQAMAQLNHPNIVAVHEVGAIGDEVFVAMEYINGPSLRTWLATQRPWREIVRAFSGCAAGLAAAHAADIVHGDFKPDNVLVGADGRMRVADFGLARAVGDDTAPRGGTPAYMAPELQTGGTATPASDQYALCVALREALAERDGVAWLRPIVARGCAAEPRERWPSLAALTGELGRDPRQRIRQIAILGLAGAAVAGAAVVGFARGHAGAAPCDDLARELTGAWDPTLRQAAATQFAATKLPFADGAFTHAAERLDGYAAAWVAMRHDACMATAVSHEQSAAILDLRMQCLDRRRAELASVAALFATPTPQIVEHAVDAARGLPAIADCADTATLGAIAPPPPDQRVAVAALRQRVTSAAVATRAGTYVAARRTAEAAATEARSLGYAPLLAEALDALGDAAAGAGDPSASDAAFREALPAAARGRDDLTAAASAVALYRVTGVIEQKLPEAAALEPGAIAAVARAGDPPALRARLLSAIGLVAARRAKLDEATRALDQAIALDRAPGGDPLELAATLVALGGVRRQGGDLPGAHTALSDALAIDRKELGPEHPVVASALANLGALAKQMNKLEEAQTDLEQALAIAERALGKDHVDVGRDLFSLATVMTARTRFDDAHAMLVRALAITQRALGDDHREVADIYGALADVAYNRNDFPEARDDHAKALAIYERQLGPDHPRVASTLYNLASVDQLIGHYADARTSYRRALDIYRRTQGDPGDIADALVQLAAVDLADGKFPEAADYAKQAIAQRAIMHDETSLGLAQALDIQAAIADNTGDHATAATNCARTLAIMEAALGATSPQLAEPLMCLGHAELGRGHAKAAIPAFERALGMFTAADDAAMRADLELGLADALWSGGGDRARARTLATHAISVLDTIAAVRPAAVKSRDEARAWLRSHP